MKFICAQGSICERTQRKMFFFFLILQAIFLTPPHISSSCGFNTSFMSKTRQMYIQRNVLKSPLWDIDQLGDQVKAIIHHGIHKSYKWVAQ